ncbi:MAG TPA: S1C family serine protease [Steroidobacteraceae bacterium]|nr:S1C family serine protease [Steroidobacteraceae bacterium]
MSTEANPLSSLSQAIESQVAAAQGLVVAVRNASHRHVSAMLWQPDVVVTSEQAIGERGEYEVVTASGVTTAARVVGRDAGTNVLVLRPATPLPAGRASARLPTAARVGTLALALGADVNGAPTARLGLINSVGAQWYSRAGGRLEQRIALDIGLGRTEEGGPVLDADGALLGMSTLGPPGVVLVIPAATLDRVVPQLLSAGQVARGWLGLGLQPVAIPEPLREAAGQTSGMMVMSIAAGGPGAAAGVTAGDILLTIDGTSMRGLRRLMAQLDDVSVGRTVALRLIRGGEVLTLSVQIAARP